MFFLYFNFDFIFVLCYFFFFLNSLLLLTHPIQNNTYTNQKHCHSRNHSMSQADYDRTPKSPLQHHHSSAQNGNMPFKPVPPPKPKNYRPMVPSNGNANNGNMPPNQWDTTVRMVFCFDNLLGIDYLNESWFWNESWLKTE